MIMFIFAIIGLTASSMLGGLIIAILTYRIIMTATRVEIHTRKRLKSQTTDHYATIRRSHE